VKKPNLCIVTEFMKQGCLRDILANHSVKLAWKHKLRLLRSAALGINYLHSLHPVIVHRDLKPSNLLVRQRSPRRVCACVVLTRHTRWTRT
jgi:serine/threonine protein kinase